jgi:hypothetical protein
MRILQTTTGSGKLFGPPVLVVDFSYSTIEASTRRPGFPSPPIHIEGKVNSSDFAALLKWHQDQTRLTLQTKEFALQIFLTDPEGHFTATGGPIPL